MGTILIQNADWVVTMDPERRLIQDGAVAIRDDRIAQVGKSADVAQAFQADKVIDGRGKLVLPGLIDTHVHNTQQLGRGVADGCDMPVHLLERLYGYEKELMEEDAYWAGLACQLELIKAGTTCYIDPGSYFPEQTGRALGESGMRGIVARTAFDLFETPIGALPSKMFRESTDVAIEKARDVVTRLGGAYDGRLRGWFALRILSGCSDNLIQQIKGLADKNGVGVVLHASESRDEVVASRMKYGMADIERMEALGALGPNMVFIHMGWVNPREVKLVVEHDLKVSCTPTGGLKLAMGSMEYGRFPEMLEFGVSVALGSDAAMSSNFLDIVRVMYLASGGAKAARLDATIMGPETVLEMATLNGAKAALWEDEIGSLETGKKADIAIFDMNKPEWRPVLNPIANLVYSSRGGAETVIIDGKVVMEGGVVQTVDEEKTLQEAQKRGEALAVKSGLWDRAKPKWPVV
jgi:5-methylthioadenosine/S-adenosylhomocysteine deaminase